MVYALQILLSLSEGLETNCYGEDKRHISGKGILLTGYRLRDPSRDLELLYFKSREFFLYNSRDLLIMEQESLFFSMGGFVLQLESFGLLTNPYFS